MAEGDYLARARQLGFVNVPKLFGFYSKYGYDVTVAPPPELRDDVVYKIRISHIEDCGEFYVWTNLSRERTIEVTGTNLVQYMAILCQTSLRALTLPRELDVGMHLVTETEDRTLCRAEITEKTKDCNGNDVIKMMLLDWGRSLWTKVERGGRWYLRVGDAEVPQGCYGPCYLHGIDYSKMTDGVLTEYKPVLQSLLGENEVYGCLKKEILPEGRAAYAVQLVDIRTHRDVNLDFFRQLPDGVTEYNGPMTDVKGPVEIICPRDRRETAFEDQKRLEKEEIRRKYGSRKVRANENHKSNLDSFPPDP